MVPSIACTNGNIFNAFETLVTEVLHHGTASESSGARRKIFSTDAVADCLALADLHRLVALATNCSQKQASD